MAQIEYTSSFKKDYKRRMGDEVAIKLVDAVIYYFERDVDLPESYRDHKLVGRLSHCRECHIKPNLLLIYERDYGTVKLHRLCNHSELFDS